MSKLIPANKWLLVFRIGTLNYLPAAIQLTESTTRKSFYTILFQHPDVLAGVT